MEEETIFFEREDLERWDKAIAENDASIAPAAQGCLLVRSVVFDDGLLGDVVACRDPGGTMQMWAHMTVYDDSGTLYCSPARKQLSGRWEVGGHAINVKAYRGNVFDRLMTTREDLLLAVEKELEKGIAHEYAEQIADAIVGRVAFDIEQCADPDSWNCCDVSLGIGRVLCKVLEVSV